MFQTTNQLSTWIFYQDVPGAWPTEKGPIFTTVPEQRPSVRKPSGKPTWLAGKSTNSWWHPSWILLMSSMSSDYICRDFSKTCTSGKWSFHWFTFVLFKSIIFHWWFSSGFPVDFSWHLKPHPEGLLGPPKQAETWAFLLGFIHDLWPWQPWLMYQKIYVESRVLQDTEHEKSVYSRSVNWYLDIEVTFYWLRIEPQYTFIPSSWVIVQPWPVSSH